MGIGVGIGTGVARSRSLSRLDSATKDWKARVIANGGTLNSTDIAAADAFVVAAKAASLWELLDWVALFAGRNLNAALVPLKRTVGDAVMTNNNFVEGNFNPAVGLTGDGTSKDLLPGILANQLSRNATIAGVCVTSLPATGGSSRGFLGTTFGASPALILYRGSSGPTNAKVHSTGTATGGNTAIGFMYARRAASGNQQVGVNTSETSSADASAAPGANPIRIFSLAGGTYGNSALGAAFFGQAMTSGQASSLRTIILAAMTTLGRPTS